MAYNTQNFEAGQVLTASALNTMDNQIQANEQAVEGINDTLNGINMRTIEIDQKTIDINNTTNNIYSYLMIDVMNKLNELSNNSGGSAGGEATDSIESLFINNLGYEMPSILKQAVHQGINVKNNYQYGGMSWLSLEAPTFMPSGIDLSQVEGVNPSEFILSWMAGYDMPNYNQERFELRNAIGAVNIGNMGTTPKMIIFGPLTTTVSFNAPFYFKNDFDGQMCLFNSCYSLTDVYGLENVDISNAQSLSYAFSGATKLQGIGGYQNWNTSGVTSMQGMFNGVNFNSLDLSAWNFSNVYNYNFMFGSCWNLNDLKLSDNFGCSAQNAQSLFSNVPLTDIVISNFNPDVTNVNNMFENCYNLTMVSLPNDFGRNAMEFWGLFSQCWNLNTINGSINVGNISYDQWANNQTIFIYSPEEDRYNNIRYLVLKDFGKYDDGMEGRTIEIRAKYWGADNRQCVIDSLVNNSFDRTSMPTLTINFYNDYVDFTTEELNTLGAKGYTLNKYTTGNIGDEGI